MIIGIGGVSRSGKTTLAKQLASVLNNAFVLHQDHYNAEPLPVIRDHIDWEIPGAVNYDALIEAVRKNRNDYEHIIVEGILIFASPELNRLYDKRIVMTLSESEFKKRKAEDLRWGKEPAWYIDHIWKSYLCYGFPSDNIDYIQINGDNLPKITKVKALLQV